MRLPRIRRFSGWVACCLCVLIPVLVGCGDYCLFCEGQGSGGGGNGNGGEEICDSVFSGLADYQAALNLNTLEVFEEERGDFDSLSLAVVPKGMSFEYGSSRTANPGDVLVADQQGTDVYVYEYPTTTKRSLGVGVDKISGMALLHWELNQTTDVDLLFFTVEEENEIYIYDLTGTSNPSAIVNPLALGDFLETGALESPTSVAVNADSSEATMFVLNNDAGDNSVVMLSVNLANWAPGFSKRIATMTETSRSLVDIAYYGETDTVYVTKKALTAEDVFAQGWVYEVSEATDRDTSENLNPDSNFIAELQNFTGLAVAFTSKQGTAADLLVSREIAGWVEQYDILDGGNAEAFFTFGAPYDFPQAVVFDCANDRLVMTHVPPTKAFARILFQAFPTQ